LEAVEAKVSEPAAPQKKEELMVTAVQNTLFSIGEGLCSSATTWRTHAH
jgi:hypothetical protein